VGTGLHEKRTALDLTFRKRRFTEAELAQALTEIGVARDGMHATLVSGSELTTEAKRDAGKRVPVASAHMLRDRFSEATNCG
jgi:hypothetical protein